MAILAAGVSSLHADGARDGVRRIALGLGDWRVSSDPAEDLVCLGLGSCVALCAYDQTARVAGMAHMVLPDSKAGRAGSGGTRFVDIAVPTVIEQMQRFGASVARIRVSLVGGAHILPGGAFTALPQIGARNLEATMQVLSTLRLKFDARETGGAMGRTVHLPVATGVLRIETAGRGAPA